MVTCLLWMPSQKIQSPGYISQCSLYYQPPWVFWVTLLGPQLVQGHTQ